MLSVESQLTLNQVRLLQQGMQHFPASYLKQFTNGLQRQFTDSISRHTKLTFFDALKSEVSLPSAVVTTDY